MKPAFLLATELQPGDPSWAQVEAQAAALACSAARVLGFAPHVGVARLPGGPADDTDAHPLADAIDRLAREEVGEIFVLPAVLDLTVWQRSALGQVLAEARRRHPGVATHHDDADPTHPLLIEYFASRVLEALREQDLRPHQAGLLLVADGRGDTRGRANSYRTMRLLWEHLSLAWGEVGFVRHHQPFLRATLERCAREPLGWVLLPQHLWECESVDYARLILADHQRAHPEAEHWRLAGPSQDHPAVGAWLLQRLLGLWQEKRAREAVRQPSPRRDPPPAAQVWSGTGWAPVGSAAIRPPDGLLARAQRSGELAELLSRVLPASGRYLVKVTWHGYATGTYTDPAALDLLLGALPGQAVVLEGHTCSRNLGGADFDWGADARQHRAWVRQQDGEFLRRTGLAEVMARHRAQYLNVTEAWWDGACAPAGEVETALGGLTLRHPELSAYVPSVLLGLRGTPLISMARFKGPTRLGVSNLFGLIPLPLRDAWHGPNITHFASVCCDLARLFGRLFPLFGLVEAFHSAVRWDRRGLYRSRWGNYDLTPTSGIFTLSEGLVAADLLASRLQGQDVTRSGFYDVVRERLGWADAAAAAPLPTDLQAALA
jgi:hypothetical protein